MKPVKKDKKPEPSGIYNFTRLDFDDFDDPEVVSRLGFKRAYPLVVHFNSRSARARFCAQIKRMMQLEGCYRTRHLS